MKSLTTNLMIAAAALIAVAGSASAQVMKAEVPFYFNAGSRTMSPGTYRVDVHWGVAGQPIVQVSSEDRRRTAVMLSSGLRDTPRHLLESGKPTLTFACHEGRCRLVAVTTGSGASTVTLPAAKSPRGDRAEIRLITM